MVHVHAVPCLISTILPRLHIPTLSYPTAHSYMVVRQPFDTIAGEVMAAADFNKRLLAHSPAASFAKAGVAVSKPRGVAAAARDNGVGVGGSASSSITMFRPASSLGVLRDVVTRGGLAPEPRAPLVPGYSGSIEKQVNVVRGIGSLFRGAIPAALQVLC